MTVLHVLHVDVEPDIREIVETWLGPDPDLMTKSCASAEHAPAVASDWTPDLILRDFVMPVMDGATTLARLLKKSRTDGIFVIFMRAGAQRREADRFRSLGPLGMTAKPFDPRLTNNRKADIQVGEP